MIDQEKILQDCLTELVIQVIHARKNSLKEEDMNHLHGEALSIAKNQLDALMNKFKSDAELEGYKKAYGLLSKKMKDGFSECISDLKKAHEQALKSLESLQNKIKSL